MLLLQRTFVCYLLSFLSSVKGGLFGRIKPQPTAQSKGASNTWGVSYLAQWVPDMKFQAWKLPLDFLGGDVVPQVATALQTQTSERPATSSNIITAQDYTVSVGAPVATSIQKNIITGQDFPDSVKVATAMRNQTNLSQPTSGITKQDYTVSVQVQLATTMSNPATERPTRTSNITTQGYTTSEEAHTNSTYQITTQSDKSSTTPAPIGTLLPHRGTKPPHDNQLSASRQTEKVKPLSEPDPNYDLEFWPSGGRQTETFPQTTSPPVTTQETDGYIIVTSTPEEILTSSTEENRWTETTKSAEFQNSKTKSTKSNSITTPGLPPSPYSEPRLLTTLPTGIQSTTTHLQPTVSTSSLRGDITTSKAPIVTKQVSNVIPDIVTVPNMSLGTETTNGPPDRRVVLTTHEEERGSLGSILDLTHSPLNTVSSAEGLEKERTEETAGKTTELTATERGIEKYKPTIRTTLKTTEMPTTVSDDWLSDFTQESALPDCNAEHSGICNTSEPWAPSYPTVISSNDSITISSTNKSQTPILFPSLPMFVPLYSDWNSAMADWGLAWEAHIYGLGSVFCLISLASALNLLCLPLCCPSGCGYFALVSLFLLAAGCTRAFALLYDAYGHQDRMASTEAILLLYEAPFPCMTAAFGLVFLLLSMRSRMQLSYSAFQRPCFLACLVLMHFAAAFGPVTLLRVDQQGAPLCLFLSLISRGAFVALATFLSIAYFVFYCYVRADSKHIYHLNNTSPTPAERYNRCPFAESQDWDRAAVAVFLSAIFCLACAGLQLYAMLHALGVAGGAELFRPWPWWAFQLSCRVCEAVICLTLALVVSQPVYCSEHLPQPGSCWMELLAAKSPIIPGSYQWTLTQQEKLAICDPIGHGETECLPLYTLVDDRMGSLNGLDLLYHSNRALAYRDLDLDLPETLVNTGAPSVGSSCTSDSTADLRPPSPINLRRSIDEALFSEALFPMSLFSTMRPFTSSDHSLEGRDTGSSSGQTLRDTDPSDPGLYRSSSCVEMLPQPPLPVQAQESAPSVGFPPSPSPSPSLSSSCCSSPERWRGSSSSCSLYRPSLAGSSLGLCSSPEGRNPPLSTVSGSSGCTATSQQRQCRTPSSQENVEQQSELNQSVQDEFISVCRQIDALSVCSETIDL
ncbi:proline-rich transmembrane protein 4 [Hoplias malabaricus]|uniref:proline-rich transmembrane protein 4 n=1 Tax=Hoplias malabaricus TaxID=27720 RepID=UPI0034636E84